ncbi:site-specific integrase [uncultured Pseudacidovorax sp.]|uniref:tyrosine-type recombinase/integrase n=1 Tax=uncultured Pseudacidovorax sp. TaxID=679313 RepID=UPI0025F144DB|nr:site-specific integrase [uncultured Pseudacidovorax sp.]
MPKVAQELSARAVAALKTDGRHAVGGAAGLHLRVKGDHRGWVLRITVGDSRRDIGLGPYPKVGLAEAREQAREIQKQLRLGTAPLAPRRAQKAALIARQTADKTFDWCAEQYINSKADEWKNPKHRQQWENTLREYVSPVVGRLSVREVTLEHVMLCLQPIWKKKNETASRLRGRIESVLDWATVHQYRSGENPARWKGHLDKILPAPAKIQKVQHHKAVPIDSMPAFMATLRTRHGVAARALEFLILTAARSGEVRGARWSEIDLRAKIWTVPAERMKAKREHRVPLSDAAVQLLNAAPPTGDLLFEGTKHRPLSDMSITAVMRRMEVDAVPHGFRSTFRDWAGDRTEFPRDLIEFALAHAIADKTEEAYRRGDGIERRRALMAAWAQFCLGVDA